MPALEHHEAPQFAGYALLDAAKLDKGADSFEMIAYCADGL
jgi:hypothetical protein